MKTKNTQFDSSDERFIDVWKFADPRYPWQIFLGGRGWGKTFSFTKGWIDRPNVHCAFMRRTLDEMKLIADNSETDSNIFYEVTEKYGKKYDHEFRRATEKSWNVYRKSQEEDGDESGREAAPDCRGVGISLSTIATMRGLNYSRVTDIALDEFITESHIKKIKNEGLAIINAYETICRNRELFGAPPVNFWAFANAFDIYNPLFQELNIVTDCERMIDRKQADKYYPDRGLAIHLLEANPKFIEQKKNTQIMKLTKGTKYYDMALENKFVFNDFSLIGYKNLKGMKPVCSLDGSTIFYNDGKYYYSYAFNKTVHNYQSNLEHEKMAFNREYLYLLEDAYIDGRITFESYALKMQLLDVIL